MFKINARRCLVIIKYNDKDISADLQQYLKNVSYTDNMSGEADDLQLTLEDKAGLWQSSWMPEKIANIDEIIASQRLDQTTPVTTAHKFNFSVESTPAVNSCGAFLQ